MALRRPLPHQATGIAWATAKNSVALFWQMRLGKTLVAIRCASKNAHSRKLVVAPLTVLRNWQDELRLEGFPSVILEGSMDKRLEAIASNPGCKWFLTNYEALALRRKRGEKRRYAVPSPLAELPWDVVILDESTRIRSPQAQTTKVALGWLSQAPRKFLLTGLANPEGPEDYFTQMAFLFGSFMGCADYWTWQRRFFMKDWSGFGYIPRRGTIQKIKEEVHRLSSVLTRKQAGIKTKKIHEIRWLTLPAAARTAYEKAEREYAFAGEETKYAPVTRIWCQRIAGGCAEGAFSGHKVEELKALLKGELKGEPVVVFFRFNAELAQVSQAFQLAGIAHGRISGLVGAELRHQRLRDFRAGKFQALLCQTTCVKYGLDMSCSSTGIFFSNWDEAEIRAQAEERMVHPQKTDPVLIIDLVCEDTVDEDILDALKEKIANAKLFQSKLVENLKHRLERRKK